MKKIFSLILIVVFLFVFTNAYADDNSAPRNLTAVTKSTSQIDIRWSKANAKSAIAGYKVFRNGVQIATVKNGTAYSDTGLDAGTAYSYSVSALSAVGKNSPQTSAIMVSTLSYIFNWSGLKAEYFDNIDFTNLIMTRVDPYINFNWGSSAPNSSMGRGNFSIRWTGRLLPLYSDDYTFQTVSDDGVALWVNGVKIIDKMKNRSIATNSGKARLVAGQKADIRLEYCENKADSTIKLYWSSKSQIRQIIPQSQLFCDF